MKQFEKQFNKNCKLRIVNFFDLQPNEGIVSLPSDKSTLWVTYTIAINCDLFGCPPSKILRDSIKKRSKKLQFPNK